MGFYKKSEWYEYRFCRKCGNKNSRWRKQGYSAKSGHLITRLVNYDSNGNELYRKKIVYCKRCGNRYSFKYTR